MDIIMKKNMSTFKITMGALYVALFAASSNIPFLSAIHLIPGVPLTLQTFLIAMMGLTLGTRGAMMAYSAVMMLTVAGVPMMSGGRGGVAVLFGPTGGYIIGFFALALVLGLYADYGMPRLASRKLWGMSLHVPVSFVVGIAGIMLDYLCGSIVLVIYGGRAWTALPTVFMSNMAFLPGDMIKIGMASVISLALFVRLRSLFVAGKREAS